MDDARRSSDEASWLGRFAEDKIKAFELIAEAPSLRQLLRHLAEAATHVFDDHPEELDVSATVWLNDPRRYELILAAAHNEPVEDPRYLPRHVLRYHCTDGEEPQKPKCFEAMESRRQIPYTRMYDEPRPRLGKYLRAEKFRSLLVTPLLSPTDPKSPAIGALIIFARHREFDFEDAPYALKLLQSLAYQAVLALHAATEPRHARAVAGLRALAMRCGTQDEFFGEAVKFIASLDCLNSPSCAIFLPIQGGTVRLVASTDLSLTSKLRDPTQAQSLEYGVGEGLTGATARLGPQHTLRIVRADDKKEVSRMESILRIEAKDPDLNLRWSHKVPDNTPGMHGGLGERSVMAHCFPVPGWGKFRDGVLRVSRPLEEYNREHWSRYMPFDEQLMRELCEVISEAVRYYGTMAEIIADLAHRNNRHIRTILAQLPEQDTDVSEDLSPERLDELRRAITGVHMVGRGAIRVNEILRPPLPVWEKGRVVPWLVPLDSLIRELVEARSEIASVASPLLGWQCEVPEDILLPERTATYLGICVNELLTNAANYSPQEEDARITVAAKRWGQRVFIEVANPTTKESYDSLRKSPSGIAITDALLARFLHGARKATYDSKTGVLTQRLTISLQRR